MKVRLLIPRSGPNGSFGVGDEMEVTDSEAKRLIEANKAAPVRSAPEPERAVARKKVSRKKVSHAMESQADD